MCSVSVVGRYRPSVQLLSEYYMEKLVYGQQEAPTVLEAVRVQQHEGREAPDVVRGDEGDLHVPASEHVNVWSRFGEKETNQMAGDINRYCTRNVLYLSSGMEKW